MSYVQSHLRIVIYGQITNKSTNIVCRPNILCACVETNKHLDSYTCLNTFREGIFHRDGELRYRIGY
jgi:hypothetical protein